MGSQNTCFACLRERKDKMIESEEHYPPTYTEFMLRPWGFEKALFGDEAEANAYFRRFEAKLKLTDFCSDFHAGYPTQALEAARRAAQSASNRNKS
jgi:hypothetical protein